MIELHLLGGFALVLSSRPVAIPAPAQRVLALLALRRRPLARVYVAGTLWLGSDEERAGACLRSALCRLQRAHPALVEATRTSVTLAPAVQVDVDAVDAAAQRILDGAYEPDGLQRLTRSGELLPDWYDEWLEIDRERIRQRRLHALDAACPALARRGRFAEAAEAGLASVAADPLRESAHRALIELHLAEGNLGEARRQFETYRRLARTRLGAEPSPALALRLAA